MSFALQTKMKRFTNKREGVSATPSKKKATITNMLTLMIEQCKNIVKDNGDPDQANFVGMMVAFMQKVPKSNKY